MAKYKLYTHTHIYILANYKSCHYPMDMRKLFAQCSLQSTSRAHGLKRGFVSNTQDFEHDRDGRSLTPKPRPLKLIAPISTPNTPQHPLPLLATGGCLHSSSWDGPMGNHRDWSERFVGLLHHCRWAGGQAGGGGGSGAPAVHCHSIYFAQQPQMLESSPLPGLMGIELKPEWEGKPLRQKCWPIPPQKNKKTSTCSGRNC